MKLITCNTNNQIKYKKPVFQGRGIDLIHNWQNEKGVIWHKDYKDVVNYLTEGAELYFREHKTVDDSVLDFHSCGGLTVFFDIPNSRILKISLENPLEFREHNPNFDIPFLSPLKKYGKTYIVIQPKADTENITEKQVLDVIKRIYKNHCELSSDGNKFKQYGLLNGKPYLLDTRCAIPLPDIYSLIVSIICRKLNKCYTNIYKEHIELERKLAIKEKGYYADHVDETPRPNLTITEGLKKICEIIRRNIKYKKNNYCVPYEEF